MLDKYTHWMQHVPNLIIIIAIQWTPHTSPSYSLTKIRTKLEPNGGHILFHHGTHLTPRAHIRRHE